MDFQTIVWVCIGSVAVTVSCFWLHTRLAGTGEHVGPVSMATFVVAWLAVITAILTGTFLVIVTVTR